MTRKAARKKPLTPRQQLARAKAEANRSKHNHKIYLAWKAAGIGEPITELQFLKERKWRFDFAWPEERIAIEVNGGGGRGRHNTVIGNTKDSEKLNAAQVAGWIVLQYTVISVKDSVQIAADLIKAALLRANERAQA